MRKVSKVVLLLILTAVILAPILSINILTVGAASGGTIGDCTWSLNGTELTISGNGEMGDCYYGAPWGTSITDVIIQKGVTTIGAYAFNSCESLTSVTIPDSVTCIKMGAFSYCSSLVSIVIPNSVVSIELVAFDSCESLSSVTFSGSVASIADSVFNETELYNDRDNWENSVLYIGNHLIEAESGIAENYVIKAGTKTIADYAFSNCEDMVSVSIPNSVTSIGKSAFSGCYSLASVTIPEGVTVIEEYTFYYCSELTSVFIPDSVVQIGQNTFYSCDSLWDVWYTGASKDEITIEEDDGGDESCLHRIDWHYNTCKNSHSYKAACVDSCSDCEWVRKNVAKHTYTNSCDTSCNACGDIREITHKYAGATCTKAKTCTVCGAVSGSALGHKYAGATCTKAKKCTVCGVTSGSALGHKYAGATCIKAKTCTMCGATSGSALGHTYTGSCDETCNRCSAKRTITHTYISKIQKATLTKNGATWKQCKECGTKSGKATLYKASKISLGKTMCAYNGKMQKPTVVVKDSKGKTISKSNYTVKWPKNYKKIGTYTVTVTLKGNYKGTCKMTYQIVPKGTSITKITRIPNALKITVKKQTKNTAGYQIQYSTNKNFKSAKMVIIKKNSQIEATLKKLKSGKKYYIRVRTYTSEKAGGKAKTIGSAWSKVGEVYATKGAVAIVPQTEKVPSIFDKYYQSYLDDDRTMYEQECGSSSIEVWYKMTEDYKDDDYYPYRLNIYRATSKNGKYKKIATEKVYHLDNKDYDSYKDEKLSVNKAYYYKAEIVYIPRTYQDGTDLKKIPALEKIYEEISVEKYYTAMKWITGQKSNSVTLSWKKVPGASGYFIRERGSYFRGYNIFGQRLYQHIEGANWAKGATSCKSEILRSYPECKNVTFSVIPYVKRGKYYYSELYGVTKKFPGEKGIKQ